MTHPIVLETLADIQRIEEAERASVATALEEAQKKGSDHGRSRAESLQQTLQQFEHRLEDELKQDLSKASLELADQWLTQSLHKRPDLLVDIAVHALHTVRYAKEVNIRVCPKDAEMFRQSLTKLLGVLSRAKTIDIREDRRLAPFSLVIETETGIIDADYKTQLSELAKATGVLRWPA